jgi:predicted nucleotide-binding protein (sugar kinase/HSP70/actin superfamily)
MLRSLPRPAGATHAATCPVCQAGPDLLRWDLGGEHPARILSPVFDLGAEGWRTPAFRRACGTVAAELGANRRVAERAFDAAVAAQQEFERGCQEIGRRALAFGGQHGLLAVVVLGRPYTIYNPILNSNVPAILREQGALAIPLECLPLDPDIPVVDDMYWGHGQQVLRAAHQLRRSPGVYAVLCSNYSCGPDSFNAHFLADAMAGKPFTVIETDGHSGDAGTRTRIEAFLHCAHEHRAAENDDGLHEAPRETSRLDGLRVDLPTMRKRRERLLVPWVSRSSAVVAAGLRGEGVDAEALPYPGQEALEIGRQHTTGKECLPLALSLGAVLQQIERDRHRGRRFAVLMPTTRGPCRFGCYQSVFKLVLERLGLDKRVAVWSPRDSDYFRECGPATAAITLAGVTTMDLLEAVTRPYAPGSQARRAADAIRERSQELLLQRVEREVSLQSPLRRVFGEVFGGGLFGCRELLCGAVEELAAHGPPPPRPRVLVTGEIYVRLDPFANGFLVEALERRGLEVLVAPLSEWFEYSATASLDRGDRSGWRARLTHQVQLRILERCHEVVRRALGTSYRTPIAKQLRAAGPLVRPQLYGEAVLTVGGPIREWRDGEIHGTVNVGPMECMPSRIAASQLAHFQEREGLPVLNLAMSGEPLDPDQLDDFAFDVRRAFTARHAGEAPKASTDTARGRRRSGSTATPPFLPDPVAGADPGRPAPGRRTRW